MAKIDYLFPFNFDCIRGNTKNEIDWNRKSHEIYFFFVFIFSFLRLIYIGDEFALRDGGSLYCKEDHDVLEKSSQSRVAAPIESNNNTNLSNNNHSSEVGSMSGECDVRHIVAIENQKKSNRSRIIVRTPKAVKSNVSIWRRKINLKLSKKRYLTKNVTNVHETSDR